MSPERKLKRESALLQMRERWNQPRNAAKKARSIINSKNASGPRPWARSPLTKVVEGLRDGDTVWVESDSNSVHRAARTAKRKVITRTAFKSGVKGVRVTAIKSKKKRKRIA